MGPLLIGFFAFTRTHYWVSGSQPARIEACARFYTPTLHLATRLFLSGLFQEKTFGRLSLPHPSWISGKPQRSAMVCPAATHSRVCHPCGTAARCFAALDWVPAFGQSLCLCAIFPAVVSHIYYFCVSSGPSFTRVFCSTLDIFFNIEAYCLYWVLKSFPDIERVWHFFKSLI